MVPHLKHTDNCAKLITFIKSLLKNLSPQGQLDLIESLDMSVNDFLDLLAGKTELSFIQFGQLAERFNFSIKGYSENYIDFDAISKQQLGQTYYLPKRYEKEKIIHNYLLEKSFEFLEIHEGPNFKKKAMDYLQIQSYIYQDPYELIGLRAVEDLNYYQISHGHKDEDFRALGHFLAGEISKTPFFKVLNKVISPQLFFSLFYQEFVPRFITDYTVFKVLKKGKGKLEINAKANEWVNNRFRGKWGSNSYCQKLIGGMTHYCEKLKIQKFEVTHPKCVHKGDSECLFKITEF